MLASVAFANGGYFPTAWGWTALLALWLVVTYLLVGNPSEPSSLATSLVAGFLLLVAWIWLSLSWTDDLDQTLLEGQRTLTYVAVAAALVLIVSARTVVPLLAGALVGVFLPAGYGLATRLFPDRLGVFDPIAGYRLQEPLGYWNALGIFASMGALLALGFALRGGVVIRPLAAAAIPILVATLYFTFSRGGWIALGLALLAAIGLDPRRLQLIAGALVVAPFTAVAVWLASRQDALTRTDAPLATATQEGHRLAVYVLLLALGSAVAASFFALAERRFSVGRTVRLAFAVVVSAVTAAALLAVFARYGGPLTLADKAHDAFVTRPVAPTTDLNKRLFSFSGSGRADVWQEAWDGYQEKSALGLGAGSYEHYWNAHRPSPLKVRDAHNLYLEFLAELGPLGLGLLVATLVIPLIGAVLARRHRLVPLAAAAYVAFLAHAAVDWDWEMPAVTMTALVCAVALLAARERNDRPLLSWPLRAATITAAVLLAGVAFVGLVGAAALSASEDAYTKGRYEKAGQEARKAARWWRWSPQPWTRLGQAQAAAGNASAAQKSFRKAISKDKRDWSLWYDLASVAEGAEARQASAEARRLNPRYPDEIGEDS